VYEYIHAECCSYGFSVNFVTYIIETGRAKIKMLHVLTLLKNCQC